jgi:hypothetical protein
MKDKFDITEIYPKLYSAETGRCKLVVVPAMRALCIRGEGSSTGPRFKDSVEALHTVAYALKALPASDLGIDDFVNFSIPSLECLWSMKNGSNYDPAKAEQAQWELFVVVPGFVTQRLINIALLEMTRKSQNPLVQEVHINTIQEKKSAQTLHLGAHSTIAKDYEKLLTYIKRSGYKPSARYHEIYLNDSAITKPNHLKTILRQPIVSLSS